MNMLEMNIEERLWAIPSGECQKTLAWRMLDDGDDFLYKGNMRCYDDILLQDSEEQF